MNYDTYYSKFVMLIVLLFVLSENIFAQNYEYSTEPRQEKEQRTPVKEKKKFTWKRDFASTVSKHTIGIDIVPFMQKLDLDEERLIDDFDRSVALPDDAYRCGNPFFQKAKPWKIIYKYNLKHSANTATFLRSGLLIFYKKDFNNFGRDTISDMWLHHSRDISFASYGLFAGIEKSYGLISALSFGFSVDLGYYISNVRYTTIKPGWYNAYDDNLGLWVLRHCSEIEKMNSVAHSFYILPSIHLEYTFLKTISLGIAANINIRYYSHKCLSHEIQFLYDGKLHDETPSGDISIIPYNENHFLLSPTFSIYVSYKFKPIKN